MMLIYDNANPGVLVVPPSMGVPNENQLIGTDGEKLSELCGRVCYDSLGAEKSRGSVDYHKHIQEVKHTSVLRHYNFTVEFDKGRFDLEDILLCLINRPGMYVTESDWNNRLRVTLNINSVLDWCANPAMNYGSFFYELGAMFDNCLGVLAPAYCKGLRQSAFEYTICGPSTDEEERWLSFYLSGSRGWSHEQVRHSWRCAVSQRSTRYCDESASNWITHPLLRDYLTFNADDDLQGMLQKQVAHARLCYAAVVQKLERYMQTVGAGDRFTARKQARGAARGFLGNALQTDMIFSASLAQWRRIIAQRNSVHADGEIMEMYRDEIVPVIERLNT